MTFFHQIFARLQKVGQSLMIPVSVLPAAGLLVALGRVLKDQAPTGYMHTLAEVLYSGGLAIFEQLPVVFAMGVAVGFTQGAGVAALASAVGYFTLTNVLKVISAASPDILPLNTGVFGGILVGAVTAWLYNRYNTVKLPAVLGFFSGKRLIPILAVAASVVLAAGLGFVWPPIQAGIQAFGLSVLDSTWGPAIYAAGKRLLIPMGLHHVFYPPFLYEFGQFTNAAGQIFKGDSARYFAGDATAGKFMASEFPLMIFGLPMACVAMILRSRPENRKAIAGMMISAALTSIITGITEPIEFAFIFVAPVLYVLHVVLAFFSGFLTSYFDIHLGYTFSASLIDFVLGFFNQKNSASFWLIVGPIIGLLYGASFYALIGMLNLKTPGRDVVKEGEPDPVNHPIAASERAAGVLAALGGTANITSLDACITRLRLAVADPAKVNKDQLKNLGAAGVMQSGPNVQAVFGVESDRLKEEIRLLMKGGSVEKLGSPVMASPGPKSSATTTPAAAASQPAAAVAVPFRSPIAGQILELSQVPDETFSEKILGDGFAVEPSEGLVTAPCDGEILHLFPTGHALALRTPQGLEILIHVGIDTVQMKGEGFKALVKIGDQVKSGQKLIEFDLALVKQKAKSTISPVVITNMDVVTNLKLQKNDPQNVLVLNL